MLRKTNVKRKLGEMIADICEVPAETVCRIPVFVLRGKHELEITGCTGVKEYTSERIVITAGGEPLTVMGDSLELADLYEKVLYIRGNISSVKYGAEEDSPC